MSNSTVRKIKIFLSSPGDVQPERDAVKRAVSWLKTLAFIRERFDLDVYAYEDTTPAVVGTIPQQVVNNYTLRPEEADIYICIFWGRMGTPFVEADITYPSGTYYEFEHAYEANQTARRPIMLLYRKTTVVPPENLDGDQYQQVNNFFATFHTQVRKGLYLRFDTLSELEDLIKRDLWTALVKDLDIFQQSSVSNETELRNLILQRFEEANVELLSYPHLIGDSYTIERDEPQRIIDWINDTTVNEKIALLVDKPGTGKTVVMSTILSLLKEQNRTVLGIKADHLSGITTVTELQERLQLPVSLEDSIRIVATNQPVVVLIDQVDALSISLSQDFSTLDLIFKFVMVLGQIPGVRVVVSCREFDLNFDPTLSRLKHKQTPTFSLAPLRKEEVSKALTSIGVKSIEKISERMFQLLSTPLHLSIYAKLLLDNNGQSGEQFYSLHQLYDALWKRHITASTVPLVSETIYRITEEMQAGRRLTVPVGILDGQSYVQARLYLQTIDFIREKQGTLFFFHQTFFDYSYARKFVAANQQLADVILSSVQGLMERSLMLQVLAYLRYANPEQYLQQINTLLFSKALRFHLRFLLLQWFASLDNISSEERVIALRLFSTPVDAIRFLQAAARNVDWFDRLGEAYFFTLLSNEEIHWRVADFLTTIISARPQSVIQLLKPFLGKSHNWDRQILISLSRLTDWTDIAAVDMFCDVMQRERDTYDVEQCFGKLLGSNPEQACRAMRVYLDFLAQDVQGLEERLFEEVGEIDSPIAKGWQYEHKLRDKYEKVLNDYSLSGIIDALAQVAPYAFIQQLLDWFINVVERYLHNNVGRSYPSDIVFGFAVYSYHTPHTIGSKEEVTFVHSIVKALRFIARNNVSLFRTISQRLQQIEAETIQFTLVQGFLANPQEYVDEIFEYFLPDERRYFLGENQYDSCLLFGQVFRFTTPDNRNILETKLLSFYPEWEKNPQYDTWGYTQTLFLQAVPRELLSNVALRRLQELERKFPELRPHAPVRTEVVTVGSPISAEQLQKATDEDILEAMRTYDDTTGWDAPERHHANFGVGGIVELSRVIGEQAKEFPERYYTLAERFDDNTPIAYIIAVLGGLASSSISAQKVFAIAETSAHRIVGHSREGFCRALRLRVSENVPDTLIAVMTEWALTDQDPPYPDPFHANADHKRLNEWLQHGINSVRGVAVETVTDCLLKMTPPKSEQAFSFLTQTINDPSPAVGACVLQSLVQLLATDQARVLDLANLLLESHLPLLEDHFTSHMFLNWASFHHFEKFGKYVERMLGSSNEFTRQEAAQMACQAALNNVTAQDLCDRSLQGDAAMRRGAATTYSHNVASPRYFETCQQRLLQLAQDDDEKVLHQVAFCFSYMRPERDLARLRSFILEMLQLPAIEKEPRHLLRFVQTVADVDHDLALDVTQRMIEVFKKVTDRHFYIEYDDTVSLPLTVYNRSFEPEIKEKAMRLFEELLEMGIRSAQTALDNWDEHRAFAMRV